MSNLEDIINLPENLEVKRVLAVKMFFSDFKMDDICKLLNVSDSFVSKWKIVPPVNFPVMAYEFEANCKLSESFAAS